MFFLQTVSSFSKLQRFSVPFVHGLKAYFCMMSALVLNCFHFHQNFISMHEVCAVVAICISDSATTNNESDSRDQTT